MAHEKIYCHTDDTWHTNHVTDEIQTPECMPGIEFQWHEGVLGVATGDLAIEDHGEASDDRVNQFLTAPLLPTADGEDTEGTPVHALTLLTDLLGEPRDCDTAAQYDALIGALRAAVRRAYAAGTAVPRMVWLDRGNVNQIIRTGRHARNKAWGADE